MIYLFTECGSDWAAGDTIYQAFKDEQKAKEYLADEFKKEVGLDLSAALSIKAINNDPDFVVSTTYCEIPTFNREVIYLMVKPIEVEA